MSDYKREAIPRSLKYYILRRDRFKCFHCGKSVTMSCHIDHFVPVCEGGRNYRCNLVASCAECNQSKGGSYPELEENMGQYHELARREVFQGQISNGDIDGEHSAIIRNVIDNNKHSSWMKAVEYATDTSNNAEDVVSMLSGLSRFFENGGKL